MAVSLTIDLQLTEEEHVILSGNSKFILSAMTNQTLYSLIEDKSNTAVDLGAMGDAMEKAANDIMSSLVAVVESIYLLL